MRKFKSNIKEVYLLCWLLHIRYLNRIVDNIYIKSHILSLYLYYNPSKGNESVKQIYQWFREYFKTYYLPNNYWIYKFELKNTNYDSEIKSNNWSKVYISLFEDHFKKPSLKKVEGNEVNKETNKILESKLKEINNEFTSKLKCINKYDFFSGEIIRRILSSILVGKCGAEISNIIFASLLRSLGYYCRISTFIPPIIIFKKPFDLRDNDRRPELWLEVFDPNFNKWISIDIHRGGWNFMGCKPSSHNSNNIKISDLNTKSERKKESNIFSKLFLTHFEDEDFDEEFEDINKNPPIPVIPLKKNQIEYFKRSPIYKDSSIIEQDEQRESLAFEFSNTKKLESLTLTKLKNKIDLQRTNIKYKANENIGWWIISVNESGFLKETTCRYVSDWSLTIQIQLKNSIRQKFESLISIINNMSESYNPRMLQLEILDDLELEKLTLKDDIIPNSKILFKNHPKYAILSCLNSLEIIYPKEPILGYFQGEPIYPRENVHILKTKLQWEHDQREIKPNQQPIKTVFKKSSNNDLKHAKKQEYFAEYQTQIKPILELNYLDQIPTDKYRSINISIKGSIPESCIHVKDNIVDLEETCEKESEFSRYYSTWKIRNILDVVKESNLNYAKAFVGYEFRNKSKPKYDGVVIKKEDVDLLNSLKEKKELININKVANIIWNDLLQNLKNILNEYIQIDKDESIELNVEYRNKSVQSQEKNTHYSRYNFKKIKNLSEKLFSESLNIINEMNKRKPIEE